MPRISRAIVVLASWLMFSASGWAQTARGGVDLDTQAQREFRPLQLDAQAQFTPLSVDAAKEFSALSVDARKEFADSRPDAEKVFSPAF